jgi:hypothetical protein
MKFIAIIVFAIICEISALPQQTPQGPVVTAITNLFDSVNPFNNQSLLSPVNPNSPLSILNPSNPSSFINPNSTNNPIRIIENVWKIITGRNLTRIRGVKGTSATTKKQQVITTTASPVSVTAAKK